MVRLVGGWALVLAVAGCDRGSDSAANARQGSPSAANVAMTKLATNSFEMVLPHTWKVEALKEPATVVGPNGERLMVSSAAISGRGADKENKAVRDEVQRNVEEAMRSAAENPQLRIITPLKREPTSNGIFAELHCKSVDGEKFFAQFSVAGPSTVVLATVEGPSSASSAIDLVRNALLKIKWLQP